MIPTGSACTWRVLSYKADSPLTRTVVIVVVEVVDSSIPFFLHVTVVAGEPLEVQVRVKIEFTGALLPRAVMVTGAERERVYSVR